MNPLITINKFRNYTFIARVNFIVANTGEEMIIIQLKAENDIDMIDEVDEAIKGMEISNIECVWYKVINNKNGLVVA